MKLLRYSSKNIFGRLSRTMVLTLFITIASVILIVFNCFIYTIVDKLESSIKSNLSGDFLICTSESTGYLFTMTGSWGEIIPMNSRQIEAVNEEIGNNYKIIKRVRMNVTLMNGQLKTTGIAFGYKDNQNIDADYFDLQLGNMLNQESENEIVISPAQSELLKADVGDTITVSYIGNGGKATSKEVVITGIGETELLLSMVINYIDYDTATSLMESSGESNYQATELVVMQGEKVLDYDEVKNSINKNLNRDEQIIVSTWSDMGEFLVGAIKLYSVILYIFIMLLLFIISVLIVNMIFVTGIERRNEIGTLRAIGFCKTHVIRIFMGEYAIISVFALAIGTVISYLAVRYLGVKGITFEAPITYVTGSELFMQFDLVGTIKILVIMLTFTMISCAYPVYRIVSLKPVEAMDDNG